MNYPDNIDLQFHITTSPLGIDPSLPLLDLLKQFLEHKANLNFHTICKVVLVTEMDENWRGKKDMLDGEMIEKGIAVHGM